MRRERDRFFGAFKGVDAQSNVITLPEVNAVAGSQNFYHPGDNEVMSVPGYEVFTTLAETARAIFSFVREESGAKVSTLIVCMAEDVYEVESDGTVTYIGTGLGDGQIDAAVANNAIYLVSGGVNATSTVAAPVYKWDGTTFAAITAPSIGAPTLAAGTGTNMSGTYYAKCVESYSDADDSYAGALSAPLAIEGAGLQITIGTGSGSGTLTGTKVYITTGDNPNFFYYVGTVIAPATNITVDISDVDLVLGHEELIAHGDPPEDGCSRAAYAQNMLCVANKEGYRSSIWMSDIRQPDSFWARRRLDIEDGDGDQITAIVPFSLGMDTDRELTLVAFKERGVWNVWGTDFKDGDPNPIRVEKSRSDTGCIHHSTIVEFPAGGDNVLGFLASDKTIRLYQGGASLVISEPVKDYLERINMSACISGNVWAGVDTDLQLAVWHLPLDSNTTPSLALAFDYKRAVWIVLPDWITMGCGTVHYEDGDLSIYTCDAGTGLKLYKMFSGDDFDGNPIEWVWRSKPLMGEDGLTKLITEMELLLSRLGAGAVTVRAWPGYSNPDTDSPYFEETWNPSTSGQLGYKKTFLIEDSEGDPIVDEELTVEVSGSSAIEKRKMLGFRLSYRPKARRRVME